MPSLVETGLVILDILIKFPSPKDPLCQVWMEFALWFWRKRVLNFANIFSPFRNFSPLEKGEALHFNKLESHSLKDSFCQVWMEYSL